MRVFHAWVSTVMVILNDIDSSSQFECLPNGAPIPGVPRSDSSSPAPDTQHAPTRQYPSTSSSAYAGNSRRLRSRSSSVVNRTTPTSVPISNVLGYGLDQLEFIRLIPFKNPQRQFKLQRYTSATDEPIELLGGLNQYSPIPSQEQIVLSTFDGDAYAILYGTTTLVGIYTYDHCLNSKVRGKVHIESGEVTPLTTDEIKEIPVGRHRQLTHGYRVELMNHNHRSLAPAEPPMNSRSSSPSKKIALPTSVPCSDGSGYGLDQLQFIRLTLKKYPNQTYKLRRFIFPVDKPILFHRGSNHYEPVPVQGFIVLTKDSGDVFAILERNYDLAGIYTYNSHTRTTVRVKINMESGTVTQLMKEEIREVPVGRLRAILNNFKIEHVD